MKSYKTIMHIWLSFVSLSGFLVGWILLGKATELSYTGSDSQPMVVEFQDIPTVTDAAAQTAQPSLLAQVIQMTTNQSTPQQASLSTTKTRKRRIRTKAS